MHSVGYAHDGTSLAGNHQHLFAVTAGSLGVHQTNVGILQVVQSRSVPANKVATLLLWGIKTPFYNQYLRRLWW